MLTLYYYYSSSTIFVQTGYTPLHALYVSLGFGAVNFLFAFPALFTIDTCESGRSEETTLATHFSYLRCGTT
jgi:hypothetical protein